VGRVMSSKALDVVGARGHQTRLADLAGAQDGSIGLLNEDDPGDSRMLNHRGSVPCPSGLAQVLECLCSE